MHQQLQVFNEERDGAGPDSRAARRTLAERPACSTLSRPEPRVGGARPSCRVNGAFCDTQPRQTRCHVISLPSVDIEGTSGVRVCRLSRREPGCGDELGCTSSLLPDINLTDWIRHHAQTQEAHARTQETHAHTEDTLTHTQQAHAHTV